jgi:hypothetical protein
MSAGAAEILRQIQAVLDTAEQLGLSSDKYHRLMREIESEVKYRVRRAARTRRSR